MLFLLFFLLQPTLAIYDQNSNGLSDLWEKQYNNDQLFAPGFDPQADPDADGWTNALEAIAGTNPFDPNPPAGHIRPTVTYTPPETWDEDGDGYPDWIDDTYVELSWPTIPGKHYQILVSDTLLPGSWIALFNSDVTGDGQTASFTFNINQADGSVPDRLFWCVSMDDEDSDEDHLTDAEEAALGTDARASDTDEDGISDMDELLAGSNPAIPPIRNFTRLQNADGTFIYFWDSHAKAGDWFHIRDLQPDGTWKVIYSDIYGSQTLPHVDGVLRHRIQLNPATDFLP